MSREDKARHTLHQTLIIDGFCQAELSLFFPPLLLSSTFCSPTSPPSTRRPFGRRPASRMAFLFALGFILFFFLGHLYFILFYFILFYCERTIAISVEARGQRLPASSQMVYVKMLK